MIPQVRGFQGCYLDNHRNNWRCARAVRALCENAPTVKYHDPYRARPRCTRCFSCTATNAPPASSPDWHCHMTACHGPSMDLGDDEDAHACGPLTVIFDLDGTLCDSLQLGLTATNTVLSDNGYGIVTPAEFWHGLRYATPERLARHARIDCGTPEFLSVGSALARQFEPLYLRLVSPATAAFYPDLRHLVLALAAGARVAALTNAARAYAEAVLAANVVRPQFDVVLGVDDVPAPKPRPDGLVQCLRALGIPPSQALYVGDSPTDGAAAAAAGVQSVGVAWGGQPLEGLEGSFDVVVSDARALRTLLLQALVASRAPHARHVQPGAGYGIQPGPHPDDPSPAPGPASATEPLQRAFVALAGLSLPEPPGGRWLFLLDRDGVINHDVGYPGVVAAAQFALLPGAARAIARLNRLGHVVCVVTNQRAIARGLLTEAGLEAIHGKMQRLLMREGAYVDRILFAPGTEDALAVKPAPDLLVTGMRAAGIGPGSSVMIGDAATDMQAGQAAGCAYRLLVTSSHHGRAAAGEHARQGREADVLPDLAAAVEAALYRIGTRPGVA